MENGNNGKSNGIFRQKSLDRISSPEELNDYIRVANPGVWLILIGIVILLGGMLVWCIFGNLETRVDALCVTEEDRTVCYVNETDIGRLQKGMRVVLSDGTECSVTGFSSSATEAEDALSEYVLYVSGVSPDTWIHAFKIDRTLQNGVESAKVIVDTVSPISFIIS